MSLIFAIIVFGFILGFLIFIHELGHFLAAKKLGVKVEEFGIGYPPKIWGVKKGETLYSLNAIPFGGFVKLFGEEEEEAAETTNNPRSFAAKSPLKRSIITLGGVTMNFLLASFIFYYVLIGSGFQFQLPLLIEYNFPLGHQENYSLITFVQEGSPADQAGLETKDIILEGNGNKIDDVNHLIEFVSDHKGEEITLLVGRYQEEGTREVKLTPSAEYPEGEGPTGIALHDVAEISYLSAPEKALSGFLHSINLGHYSLVSLGYFVKNSVVHQEVQPLAESVVGPVGILAITELTIEQGIGELVLLLALISLALFLVNALPIPPLDGGKFVLIIIEALTGKRVPLNIEKRIQEVGIIFFIALFILVTLKDLFQFKDILFK